ncbi:MULTISPECIES: hypothetical protein [Cohnella]|uniref:hypothetical protein n=1 Tax=Cohnella TaxID=329857 RepID=UPI0009BA2DE8|nr:MULTISPECIES: hypothetical protein [Cohnella]MBN2980255.1 hypothetical protein [Cohnella algarum]
MSNPLTAAVLLLLVFWTGTALFIAVHPEWFRSWVHRLRGTKEPEGRTYLPYRIGALVCGIAGFLGLSWIG